MVEDVLRALGFLCLGSRLKRIGERFQADTQRVLDELGIPVQSSQFPFLAAVDRLGPLAIGELAEAIGITQPGATRSVAQLIELGFLEAQQAPEDQRRKVISLTRKGQRLIDLAKREAWPRIAGAVTEVCGDLSGPLLDQLGAIEDRLSETPLSRRATKTGRR